MLRTSPRLSVLVAALVVGACALTACGTGSPGGGATTVVNEGAQGLLKPLEPTPASPSVAASPTADAAGRVVFAGVTVADALDVGTAPTLTAANTTPAPGLLVQDLVVGTGAAANPTADVALHYVGALYTDGTRFDTNFDTADPSPRALGSTISGFAQGVGGTAGVPPMREGGRRLLVFPASLGYGAVPEDAIPAHSSLVFVVDLLHVR